jgi:hypothetical protein
MRRPTLSDLIREYLRGGADAGGRGGQTALAHRMGIARQQLRAALKGKVSVMLKDLDGLIEADGSTTEALLLELLEIAHRTKPKKRSAA